MFGIFFFLFILRFHCDEVLALKMLTSYTKDYKNAKIIRSREKEVIDKCDVVVDVGGQFDPKRNRYDHHQRGFNETFTDKYTIKLSSAGLIYKYFAKEIIRNILQKTDEERKENNEWTDQQIDAIQHFVYCNLIEGVDALDNGISQYDSENTPKYRVLTDLGSRVQRLNPNWKETNKDPEQEMERFEQAMTIVEDELLHFVKDCAYSWLPAQSLVQNAIDNRFKVHSSGLIMELPQFCPWTDHFFEMEEKQDVQPKILFLIFPEINSMITTYRIRAVPVHSKSFELRKGLKEEWRGVRDDELENVTGIKGSMFVHASGFMAGNKTKEGAIQMAVKSL